MLDLLSIEEAAKEMKVSIYTIRSWQYQRKFPVHKLGRRVLIARRDLEEFFQKGRVEAQERG